MNPLIKKFKEYGNISQEIENELIKYISSKTKEKGDFLLKQGQIVSSLFLIETGLVRSYYIKDDREINSWFGFENIIRSEEHTSELQSRENLVCRLLLEKKKKNVQ